MKIYCEHCKQLVDTETHRESVGVSGYVDIEVCVKCYKVLNKTYGH
jgi:NAD-dependent SIR2 family protein deacetylase